MWTMYMTPKCRRRWLVDTPPARPKWTYYWRYYYSIYDPEYPHCIAQITEYVDGTADVDYLIYLHDCKLCIHQTPPGTTIHVRIGGPNGRMVGIDSCEHMEREMWRR